jgi:hypothetical protein
VSGPNFDVLVRAAFAQDWDMSEFFDVANCSLQFFGEPCE